jgi:hypothetical protein
VEAIKSYNAVWACKLQPVLQRNTSPPKNQVFLHAAEKIKAESKYATGFHLQQ